MSLKCMSDQRQELLIKSAESVLSYMNIGIDPTAALKKVAQESELNANEVDLVSSAVNNSKTLATLQTAKPEDKGKPFPLTNAKTVVDDLFPDYKEDLSQAADDRKDQKNITIKQLNKNAVADSYHDYNDYRFGDLGDFRSVSTIGQPKVATVTEKSGLGNLKHLINEASLQFTVARDGAETSLSKVAAAFRYSDAPKFERVEKIAHHAGVTPELVDMVYVLGGLEGIGQKRASDMQKTASSIRALPSEYRLLQELIKADTLWKEAADHLAQKQVLMDEYTTRETKFYAVKEATEDEGVSISANLDTGGVGPTFDNLIGQGLGGDNVHDAVMDVAGVRGDSSKPADKSPILPLNTRQQLGNNKAQETLSKLMGDQYVGGHKLPDVIDSYNRAMSVNPEFGEAELLSYIRQDLATEGGMPLDMQIRARADKPAVSKDQA